MRYPDVAWSSLLLLLLGCGAPAEPAKTAEDAPVAADEAAPAAEGEGEGKPSEGASDKAPSSDASAPASAEDLKAILQLVVDDPELDRYLKLGEPGRFPLQVSGDRVPKGIEVIKATKPVKFVDGPGSKKDAVLAITEIDVQGDKATVRYRYDIEGIRGTVTLQKSAHGWELKNSRVVEH